MSRTIGTSLVLLFITLSVITSSLLWIRFGNFVLLQLITILIIAGIGEHYVSGKGYYHYTEMNGFFIGRVPIWIPLMWIVAIQGSYIALFLLGFKTTEAIALSGIVCASIDFYLVEPLLSRRIGMWLWNPVNRGYFSFIPPQVNRFTAPFGNYMTWMVFPVILNGFLYYVDMVLTLL